MELLHYVVVCCSQRCSGGAGLGDLQTAVLSVISETIRAYADLRFLQERLHLARAEADILRERTTLTARRYLRGLADSFELLHLQRPVAGTPVPPGLPAALLAGMTDLYRNRGRSADTQGRTDGVMLQASWRLANRPAARSTE